MTHAWPLSDPIYVPAGSWVRERWLRRGSGEWAGMWHLATGDVVVYLHHHRKVRTRCGLQQTASIDKNYEGVPIVDVVTVDEMPLVDVCLRCVRISGAKVTVRVRERLVTITDAPTA